MTVHFYILVHIFYLEFCTKLHREHRKKNIGLLYAAKNLISPLAFCGSYVLSKGSEYLENWDGSTNSGFLLPEL